MRRTHPTGRYEYRNADPKINLWIENERIQVSMVVDEMRQMDIFTFCAVSAQHDSLHFAKVQRLCGLSVSFVTVVTGVVTVCAGSKAVVAFTVVLVTWFGVDGGFSASDWANRFGVAICGLLECKIFVKPLPANDPFGESPVTTTDGARTRRGLNIAGISLSRVILTILCLCCSTGEMKKK